STNLPGTAGSPQPTFAGFRDGFLALFTSNLKTLRSATYIGGTSEDDAFALAVATFDRFGIRSVPESAIVTGLTSSTDLPGTTGGAQPTNGGGTDAFVERLVIAPYWNVTSIGPLSVSLAGSVSTTVTVTSFNGFQDPVKLHILGDPNGG